MGYLSRKTMLHRWQGDREAVREQIELFLEHAPTQLRELQEAIQVAHANSLVQSVSSLKGLAQPFRVKPLSQVLSSIEGHGERGDIERAQELFGELRGQIDEVYGELLEFLQDLDTVSGSSEEAY